MESLKKLCRDMEDNKHILTFSQIGEAAVKGATIGFKSHVPGGLVIGATLAVCVEAGESVVLIAQDLVKDPQRIKKQRPDV